MKFSEAEGRKVVSTSTAETVGKITDYIIDPNEKALVGIVLKKTSGDEDTVPWSSVDAFGEDAVMIKDAGVLVVPSGRLAELTDKRFRQHGKLVLSSAGVDLGKVDDVEFDPKTGALTTLVLNNTAIDGGRLLAAGSYAVIVQA
jgi:sporulation protein YlmC with PRC-barrel domain